jgi:hypothetical protein
MFIVFHFWRPVPVQVRTHTQTYRETYQCQGLHHHSCGFNVSLAVPCTRPSPESGLVTTAAEAHEETILYIPHHLSHTGKHSTAPWLENMTPLCT